MSQKVEIGSVETGEHQIQKVQDAVTDTEQETSLQPTNSVEHTKAVDETECLSDSSRDQELVKQTECDKNSIKEDEVRKKLSTGLELHDRDSSTDSDIVHPVSVSGVTEFSNLKMAFANDGGVLLKKENADKLSSGSGSEIQEIKCSGHTYSDSAPQGASTGFETQLHDICDGSKPSIRILHQSATGVSSACAKDAIGATGVDELKCKGDFCVTSEEAANDKTAFAKSPGIDGKSVSNEFELLTTTNVDKLSAQSNEEPRADEELNYKVDASDVKIEVKDSKKNPVENLSDENVDDKLMGFHFTDDGVLVDRHGKKFNFQRYDSHARNQERYEMLGEKITEYIYSLLETRCNLKKVYIPLDAKEDEAQSFIFVSEGAFDTEDKLMILIHGSGVVRAGQWARSLIINHSLSHGTQIPYIEKAMKEGYEVMVLNTNLNSLQRRKWPDDNELIRGSEDPESHAVYVWENLIEKKSKANHIAVVAHSYGGVVTKHLVNRKMDQFCKRGFAIAFTDSVHYMDLAYDSTEVIQFFNKHARNWVTSFLPLDEPIRGTGLRDMNDAPRFSAGHTKHEWTSWSSIDAIFKFLDEKYSKVVEESEESKKLSSHL